MKILIRMALLFVLLKKKNYKVILISNLKVLGVEVHILLVMEIVWININLLFLVLLHKEKENLLHQIELIIKINEKIIKNILILLVLYTFVFFFFINIKFI